MSHNFPVPMSNSDIGRYMRHIGGESLEEIATIDGVKLGTVEESVARGAQFEKQRIAIKVQSLRDQGALQNERFRQQVREKCEPKVLEAIDKLLNGKNVVAEVNKETGAVTLREYDDPNMLLKGVETYRKTVSLEEKPQATTVIQNNIQQNNTQNTVGAGAEIMDFESTLAEIRRKQKEAHSVKVIDVKPEKTSTEADF